MNDLFRSAMLGDLKTLVEAGSESALHVSDEKGTTLLFYEVMSDNPDMLAFLKEAGLSVNAQWLAGWMASQLKFEGRVELYCCPLTCRKAIRTRSHLRCAIQNKLQSHLGGMARTDRMQRRET